MSDKIYKMVDRMPYLPVPASQEFNDIRYPDKLVALPNFAQAKGAIEYVYERLCMPDDLIETETVVIGFIVEQDGTVSCPEVMRSKGLASARKEALRVIQTMMEETITWVPGQHQGETVRVKMMLPIFFRPHPSPAR